MSSTHETQNPNTVAASAGHAAQTLPVGAIRPAERNVHAAERPGDPAFRGLVESIRAVGLIQRIVVRPVPGGEGAPQTYAIVDGHRRFEAAKAAGLREVPVDVCEIPDGEEGALELTVAANRNRLESDPLLEAEAVERLIAAGRSREEVAAAMGRPVGYVARRARLASLAAPWREFARRVPCTADLLERVAAHETALQERVAAEVGLADYEFDPEDEGSPCGWREFEDSFRRAVMSLDEAGFDTADCRSCPSNTACHQFLFPWLETEEGHGARCQDPACFARRRNEAVAALLAKLRRAGTPALEVSSKWDVPAYWDAAEKTDRKHPQAYVFDEGGGLMRVLFGVPRPPRQQGAAQPQTAEERAAARAGRELARLLRSARDRMRRRIGELCADVDAFRDAHPAIWEEIASTRLARELGDGAWMPDDLVDDFATFYALAPDLPDAERTAWEGEMSRLAWEGGDGAEDGE